jgi:hypothetical protein
VRDPSITPNSFLSSHASPGVSEDALAIEREIDLARGHFDRVAAFETPRWDTALQIGRVFDECSADGWDGHGATAIDPRSYSHAVLLVLRLPPGTTRPEVTAEPDGEIALEWHRSPERFLIVSVSKNRELTYTWRVGHERAWGVRRFEDEIPADVLECLGRVTR